jgi:hypothetical protein
MPITQLNPPLPLHTAKGSGWAHFIIDYGPEADLMWVVFLDDGGVCWTVPNPEIRMAWNWSLGRRQFPDRDNAETVRPAAVAPIRPVGTGG